MSFEGLGAVFLLNSSCFLVFFKVLFILTVIAIATETFEA